MSGPQTFASAWRNEKSNRYTAAGADHRCVSAFYDRAYWLYPLVDLFCAPARRRLITYVNQQPAGRLLEVGVGPGRHLSQYRRHEITAVDCSARMVASCQRHAPAVAARQMDGERLEFPAASYHYVALCHVLSVTPNPSRMLTEAYRVLRPGGRAFVLNHETPENAWRHVDALLVPLARQMCFRSWFRLEDIAGVERYRLRRLECGGGLGLINAYSLEK